MNKCNEFISNDLLIYSRLFNKLVKVKFIAFIHIMLNNSLIGDQCANIQTTLTVSDENGKSCYTRGKDL